MKKLIPLMATLLIAGVCFTWTVQSNDDDKPREGDRDKPREGDRDKPREGDRDKPREGDREHARERDGDGQARELEEWLEQREKQINSLRKQGKPDQAEALAKRTRTELAQHRKAMAHRERGHGEGREHDHGDGGDNEEFGKWVNQQERHIAELRKAGKKEEAAKVLKHVQDAIAKFRGQGEHGKRGEGEQDQEVRKFLEQAERKINELRKQGKHEEAEKLLRHVKAEMAERREHGKRGEREHGNEARMKHIGAAIEHLQAAGLRDWAEELAAHARRMNKDGDREGHTREAREDREEPGHRHENHEHKHGEDEGNGDINQLRREMNEMRNALREIQKHLEKRR